MDCNEGGGGGGSTKTEERREALVYMWGYLPGVSPEKSPIVSLSPVRFPNRMEGGYSWKDVCGGGCGFAMAISECGKLMTWGSTDDEGQSYVVSGKHGGTPEAYPLPTEASILKASAGWAHCVAVTDAGALLTFGWGLYGQCGQGNTIDQLRPSYVKSLSETKVKNIAAGLWHTLCVSVDGRVYAFGGNQFGQLGTGADEGELQTLPKILDSPGLGSKHAKVASCGARHSVILTEDGQLFSWGWNKYGQLGLGDSVDRNIPSQVSIEGCLTKNIACGWWHTLLLAERPI